VDGKYLATHNACVKKTCKTSEDKSGHLYTVVFLLCKPYSLVNFGNIRLGGWLQIPWWQVWQQS